MKITIDINPIQTQGDHAVRGVGSYTELLYKNLKRFDNSNEYIFLGNNKEIDSSVDIIHYPYFDPFSLTLPFLSIKKSIVTVHDLIPLVFQNHFEVGLRGSVKWFIQKKLLKNVKAIITDSNCSKKDIIRLTDIQNDKIHVVYLAISDSFRKIKDKNLLKKIKAKYNLPENFVLYVGDVTWNKNVPRLIEALKTLDIPVVLVGKTITKKIFDQSNSWNSDLTKIHRLTDGNPNFLKLGFIGQDDLIGIYNLATVLAIPSYYEGFGLPILEAMQCGCPVVTSERGSIPEVGLDAVVYIDPENTESIRDGIKSVLNDKRFRDELSKKGIERAGDFTIKKFIENTVAVYSSFNAS